MNTTEDFIAGCLPSGAQKRLRTNVNGMAIASSAFLLNEMLVSKARVPSRPTPAL